MNSLDRYSLRNAEALAQRLRAQCEGVGLSASATHANNLLISEALEGVMSAQEAVIWQDENPPALPIDCRPWAVATVSTPRKTPPLFLPPPTILYATEKVWLEADSFGSVKNIVNDAGHKTTFVSELKLFLPKTRVKAWDLEALIVGIIREGYSKQIDKNDFINSALVDIERLDAPEDVVVPKTPDEWVYLFHKVHAQYEPMLTVSLALPSAIKRNSSKRTFMHVISLKAIEEQQEPRRF